MGQTCHQLAPLDLELNMLFLKKSMDSDYGNILYITQGNGPALPL
jgi:hypothetical protein